MRVVGHSRSSTALSKANAAARVHSNRHGGSARARSRRQPPAGGGPLGSATADEAALGFDCCFAGAARAAAVAAAVTRVETAGDAAGEAIDSEARSRLDASAAAGRVGSPSFRTELDISGAQRTAKKIYRNVALPLPPVKSFFFKGQTSNGLAQRSLWCIRARTRVLPVPVLLPAL